MPTRLNAECPIWISLANSAKRLSIQGQQTLIAQHIAPKLFVIDTNVILHDANCIRNFEENDIVVPIVVLEELDRFKKGNDDINFQARAFLRLVDDLTGDVLSCEGASLGPGLGQFA